jgi:molecular chaperone DnaK
MVKDAESHADEDRKFQELVTVRNSADGMIHAAEKAIVDLGDKVDADEKVIVESSIAELREAIKGDDKEDIESKTQKLTEASSKIAEKAYAQGAPEGAPAAGESAAEAASEADDDVVDAEFEEVDEKKA